MRCGDTFLARLPGSGPKPHLWILLTEPDRSDFLGVVVSITTLRIDRDQTVILQRGDHPFIVHQSVVLYQDCRIIDVQAIENSIQNGTAQRREPCHAAILKLIQDGAFVSDFTPGKVVDFLEAKLR